MDLIITPNQSCQVSHFLKWFIPLIHPFFPELSSFYSHSALMLCWKLSTCSSEKNVLKLKWNNCRSNGNNVYILQIANLCNSNKHMLIFCYSSHIGLIEILISLQCWSKSVAHIGGDIEVSPLIFETMKQYCVINVSESLAFQFCSFCNWINSSSVSPFTKLGYFRS